jgi:hypothetical protein
MLIDHIGYILLEDNETFRIIGRLSFPLFAFIIAFSATKTRSLPKYMLRLFIFAIISQLGQFFVWYPLNVFFTLGFGVLCIYCLNIKYKILGTLFCIMVFIAATMLPLWENYGSVGVLLIVLFYLAIRYAPKYHKLFALPSLAVFNVLLSLISDWGLQWWSCLSFVFILLFNERKVKSSQIEKWAFYVFYPLHLLVLYSISYFLL